MKVDKDGFHIPAWPMACPPVHPQADVLSVTVGNTHLTWTLHGSFEQEFIPRLFWRTSIIDDDDDDDDDEESPSAANKKLKDFLTESAAESLFGSTNFTGSSATQFRFTLKRIPYIYVYVVSTNPTHALSLVSLFKGIPCILYRLSGTDFINLPSNPPLVNENTTNAASPPITIYDGIGVDRVANIVGATALFPKSKHVLVIDGGTAMTYTTIVRVPCTDGTSDNKTSYRLQLGGGISPGLNMRLRSLHDYTADLPLVDTSYMNKLVNDCKESKKPLPLFTSSSVSKSTENETDNDEDRNIPSKSIIGCTMTETALILCSIIRKWLTIPHNNSDRSNGNGNPSLHSDLLTMPVVVLTGGDAEMFNRLLQPYHSYICDTNDSNYELLNQALVDDDHLLTQSQHARKGANTSGKTFLIHCEKRLQNHAISHVLSRHCIASVPAITADDGYNCLDIELARKQLPGLRVAKQTPKSKTFAYGTIVASQRGNNFDDDRCIVMFDDDKKMHSLKVDEIYASFQQFLDAPEKFRTRDEGVRIGQTCRRKDVAETIALLLRASPTLREAESLRKPAAEDRGAAELATLKRKNKSTATSSNKRIATAGPVGHEMKNRRIAKYFENTDDNGDKSMSIFFGTVTQYVEEQNWWHITYDDGDNEDMSVNELTTHLLLYEENKNLDEK